MATARSIRTRLSRIAHAAVASYTAVNTVENWTERFLAASPAHRQVMDQITERARIHTRGFIDRDTGQMHAGHAITSMLHQLPELLEPCEARHWRSVADADVAMPIMQRFLRQLTEYQRQTRDLCPGLWGIRELVTRPVPSQSS